jgi:monovalent cation:H+ antiporter, CPA1 family
MPVSEILLIAMGLLTVAILAAGLFQRLSIPYTVLLVVIGIALSELQHVWPNLHALDDFKLTPELVFFIFLPALIFESGLSLDARQLVKDIAPVLTLAVPALLISTTLVGYALWFLLDLELTTALLFGALISATDPVAVVALFRELGAPLRLNILVEGESLFNDATAIVVFGILLAMVMEGTSVGFASTAMSIVEFIFVFLGGAVVGMLIGLIVSEMLFRLKSNVSAILTMSVVTAYASFIIGEHLLHVSGVIATVSASLTLSIYGMTRIPVNVKPVLIETWEFFGLVANSLLFILLGLSIDLLSLLDDLNLILITVVVVLLARAAGVYTLVPITTRLFRLPEIALPERHIMWWGGLKGGLAIAIVLSIPETLPGRDLLINLTLGVVLFTLIVNAWSIRPLMHRLKMDVLTEDELSEFEHELQRVGKVSSDTLRQYRELGILSSKLSETLDKKIRLTFENATPNLSGKQVEKRIYLISLKAELKALNELYSIGIIDQYTLLDIKNNLQIDRENIRFNKGQAVDRTTLKGTSIFKRIELKVIAFAREKNWAIPLLSHYQSLRLKQRIQRKIAGIVMSYFALEKIKSEAGFSEEQKLPMIELHQNRLKRRKNDLQELRDDYRDMFVSIEKEMFTRAALISAKAGAEDGFHHGEIGIKAFNKISSIIAEVLMSVYDAGAPDGDEHGQALANIPLFSGLSKAALKVLSDHAQQVTFLADDTIIGEGDKGDALYLIKKGSVSVTKKSHGVDAFLQELKEGDFFGEMALLDGSVRTATVRAKTTVVTIRLKSNDVAKAELRFPEIAERLKQERDLRLKLDKKLG